MRRNTKRLLGCSLIALSYTCGSLHLHAGPVLDIFPPLNRDSRFSLGLSRKQIGSAYEIFSLRHSNHWAYLSYEDSAGIVYEHLKHQNYQALELDLDLKVFLPVGLCLSTHLPLITVKTLPDPGYDGVTRTEEALLAEENTRIGDVVLELAAARSRSRYFGRVSLGMKFPTGLPPYELEEPLMATGTGSRDILSGVSGGLRLWILKFAAGFGYERRAPLRASGYLFLRHEPQEIDPGDVTIACVGMRANMLRDSHQDAVLSCTYYRRSQGSETCGGEWWTDTWDTHYLVTDFCLLFKQELMIGVTSNCYGMWFEDGVIGYHELSWSLRVALLFG